MRQLIVTTITASLMALTPPVDAHHRPNFYCSKTGDICQSSRKVGDARKLRIRLAAKYFSTFHLCVLDPDGYEICAPFRVRERDSGNFERNVKWRRHFVPGGPGAYRVSWWVGDDRVGRKLGFHVSRN